MAMQKNDQQGATGGNASTTNVPREQDQQIIPNMMQQQEGHGPSTQGSSTSRIANPAKKTNAKRKK